MKRFNALTMLVTAFVVLTGMALTSCSDDESYAELLNDERHACNAFLANFKIEDVPADSVFEVGSQAPYYKLDDDGNVYMQVLKTGDLNDKAKKSQYIYFRFTRYNLITWYTEDYSWNGEGNADDMSASSTYFMYNDYTLPSSSEWGYGLQMPLNYLGVNCEVNLVIKSQYGTSSEISYVQPYMYHVRYFHSKI